MLKFKDYIIKIRNKHSEFDSIITIFCVMIFAILVFVIFRQPVTEQKSQSTAFYQNKAEQYYYQGEYDKSIEEYQSMQQEQDWPIYKANIATVYTAKKEYKTSNNMLDEAVSKRNEIVNDSNIDEYRDRDSELGNIVTLTYLLNGETQKAESSGEYFQSQDGDNKTLDKTMVMVYLANGKSEKAKQIADNYNLDTESASDTASLARVYFLLSDYDKAIDLMKDAWNLDKNELRVFDIVSDATNDNNDKFISNLINLSSKNPKEVSYKIFLLKYYQVKKDITNNTDLLLPSINDSDNNNYILYSIKRDIFENRGDATGAKNEDNSILDIEDDSSAVYNLKASTYISMKDYTKANEECIQSILADPDYAGNYTNIMPLILSKEKRSSMAEGYYLAALYKDPSDFNVIKKIGDYYNNSINDSDTAYRYYELASKIKVDDAEILYSMAQLKISENDYTAAITLLDKCSKINNKEIKYPRAMGTVYYLAGKNEQSIAKIREAYQINSNDAKTLNNAGCYYFTAEKDILRGMVNLKYAYNLMDENTDIDTKQIITENYQKAKQIYSTFIKDTNAKLTIPDMQMVN